MTIFQGWGDLTPLGRSEALQIALLWAIALACYLLVIFAAVKATRLKARSRLSLAVVACIAFLLGFGVPGFLASLMDLSTMGQFSPPALLWWLLQPLLLYLVILRAYEGEWKQYLKVAASVLLASPLALMIFFSCLLLFDPPA